MNRPLTSSQRRRQLRSIERIPQILEALLHDDVAEAARLLQRSFLEEPVAFGNACAFAELVVRVVPGATRQVFTEVVAPDDADPVALDEITAIAAFIAAQSLNDTAAQLEIFRQLGPQKAFHLTMGLARIGTAVLKERTGG